MKVRRQRYVTTHVNSESGFPSGRGTNVDGINSVDIYNSTQLQ